MQTDDVASRCGLGCVNLGAGGRHGIRLVHRAMDLGVRFFDTADAYGGGASERVIGRALRRRRDRAFVATKAGYLFRERTALEGVARRVATPMLKRVGRLAQRSDPTSLPAGRRGYAEQNFSMDYIRAALDDSLRRLGTDYVDLYQLHGPPGVCNDDVLGLMLDLRSEGKIRGFGVGLESLDHAIEWLDTGALASIQIPFGVLDPEAADEVIPSAKACSVPAIVRGVFAGGYLVPRSDGRYVRLGPRQQELRTAVMALASDAGVDALQIGSWFVTAHPGVTTVLVGTSSARHLEQSLRYIEARPPDEMRPLLAALVSQDGVVRAADLFPPEGRSG